MEASTITPDVAPTALSISGLATLPVTAAPPGTRSLHYVTVSLDAGDKYCCTGQRRSERGRQDPPCRMNMESMQLGEVAV